eukprot:3803259-Amphidinium_carterae.1
MTIDHRAGKWVEGTQRKMSAHQENRVLPCRCSACHSTLTPGTMSRLQVFVVCAQEMQRFQAIARCHANTQVT